VRHYQNRIRGLQRADRVDVLRGDITLPLVRKRAYRAGVALLGPSHRSERGNREREQRHSRE